MARHLREGRAPARIAGSRGTPPQARAIVRLISFLLGGAAWPIAVLASTATFTSSGSWTVPTGVTSVEVLVVGGGGGGGGPGADEPSGRGGGGGGGVKYSSSYSVTPGGSVTVTIGAGGAADSDGGNSSFGTLVAHGGGHGGTSGTSANSGGSGGGASYVGSPGSGTSGEGRDGGYGLTDDASYGVGGGGGGASAAGANAADNGGIGAGGAGGAGLASSISGTSITYGSGGGGGGDSRTGAPAGAGGSGAGAGSASSTGSSGTANRGGGGGGGNYNNNGGSGGSGVVVIAWVASGPPTITSPATTCAFLSSSFSYQITANANPSVTSYGASNLPPGLSVNTSTGVISGTPTSIGSYSATVSATNSAGTGSTTVVFGVANQTTTLTSSGTWTVPTDVTAVNVLIVAGGGGGGSNNYGGGGGGGGVIQQSGYTVTPGGTITVTVGAGGSVNGNGANSVFGSLTAIGGGRGGPGGGNSGLSGGSGGGANGQGAALGGSGTSGQGFAGGSSSGNNGGGAGGGGAMTLGADGASNTGGAGGTGFTSSINGTSTTYGGGGGGGAITTAGSGGSGGGGAGGTTGNATAGTANRGGGGGGGGVNNGTLAGAGGSGVVVIAWSLQTPVITSATTASATVGTAASYSITATYSPTSYGATGLPPGLSVNTSTGAISGTPTTPGIYSSTISATNAAATGSASLTWTVGATLPYTVGFESAQSYATGSVAGQGGWTLSQGSADVVTSDYAEGSRSLALQSGSTAAIAQQVFAASSSPNVTFIDLYAKPVAASSAAASSIIQTESAQIGFQLSGGQGVVYAFDGVGSNTWVATAATFAINGGNQATSWLHLAIRADYTNKKWDIWVNDVLVEYDLAFSSNSETFFRSLTLKGVTSAAAYVDGIRAQSTNPWFTDADKDGLPDSWETADGLSASTDDRNSDHDSDGRSNIEEYFLGTAANNADVTNPTAPSSLHIISTTPSSIGISWSNGADTGAGTPGVAGYNVYRNGVKVNSSLVTGQSYVATGLSTGSSYTFTVRSVDLAGNVSSASTGLAATSADNSSGSFEIFTPLP